MSLEPIAVGDSGGGSNIIIQQTEPSDPSNGDQWLDTSFNKSEYKIYHDGVWEVIVGGSNVPPRKRLESDSDYPHTWDVSSTTADVTFQLETGSGQDASYTEISSEDTDPYVLSALPYDGANGRAVEVSMTSSAP